MCNGTKYAVGKAKRNIRNMKCSVFYERLEIN